MFDGAGFPASLDEETFDTWFELGRQSKIGHSYMLVIWDDYDSVYLPVYVEDKEMISSYEMYGAATSRESLVAAYDLYSESRVG
jgi:hypothetical protein